MSKYRAKRIQIGNLSFDSRREAARWQELVLLERAGEIRDLRRQVPIEMQGRDGPILTGKTRKPRRYVADFVYHDNKLNVEVIEDAKGFRTPEYSLKKAVLAAMGVEIREV